MHPDSRFPICPPPLALALRGLPAAPLSILLTRLTRRLVRNHPSLIRRLGPHGGCRFAIDPTDLPVTLLLEPHETRARVTCHREAAEADARIAGPLAALLGLVHGAWDGDALFFSRDLVIEGDTSAALALRNAIDDAELDLGAEIAGMSGPLAAPLSGLFARAERLSGLPLHRAEEPA